MLKIRNLDKIDFLTVLLEGFLLILVLSGLVGLPLIKLKLSFVVFEIAFLIVLCLICLIFVVRFRGKVKWRWDVSFLIVFLLLVCNDWIYVPAIEEDMTLEIIRTTIATNTMYQYNPATGKILELGMYPISKVVTLPLVYSVLIDITGMDAKAFLYGIVPACILIFQFAVVGKWGKLLFGDNRAKRQLFLVWYGIILLFGDYLYLSYSYRILHMGWRGETIVMGICIPYLSYLCVQLLKNGIRMDCIMSIVLCLLAGIFVAPLAISLGLQGLVLVAFILVYVVRRANGGRINKTV